MIGDSVEISVIVPARDAEATVVPCLQSVLRDLPAHAEVVLAYHASQDATIRLANAFNDPRLHVVSVRTETVSAVRNRAAETARGSILAFLDADCVVPAGYFQHVLADLSSEEIAAAGAQYALPAEPAWVEHAWHHLHAAVEPTRAKYVPAGNLSIRSQTFRALGGFDETLPSGEDAELCQRLRLGGGVLRIDPALAVVHLGNPKTLRSFYRQQRWHAVGMLGTARRTPTELATLALISFWVTVLAALALLLSGGPLRWAVLGKVAALVLTVPVLTTMYRAAHARALRHVPAGILLYAIYFSARTTGALRALLGRGTGAATRRR